MEKASLVVAEADEKTEAASMLEAAAKRLLNGPPGEKGKSLKNQSGSLRIFEVQFNPDTIELSSTSESKNKTEMDDTTTTEQYVTPEEKQLSFELQVAGASTQNVVNGLIGLLNGGKRTVMFCWGKMHFLGRVSSIRAEYTMFEHTGMPIRGKVSMSILQSGLQGETERYWNQAFKKLTN